VNKTKKAAIAFATVEKEDPGLEEGKTKVTQPGMNRL